MTVQWKNTGGTANQRDGSFGMPLAYTNQKNRPFGLPLVCKGEAGVKFSAKQKRALETVSASHNGKHQPTVVSSADGAKILNSIDKLVESLEKSAKSFWRNLMRFFTKKSFYHQGFFTVKRRAVFILVAMW